MKKIILALMIFLEGVLQVSHAQIKTQLAQEKKVLFVVSAASALQLEEGTIYQTGVFLSEFYLPYKTIRAAGYEIDFATPGGKTATVDPGSLNEKYWKNYPEIKQEAMAFVKANEKFNSPMTLEVAIQNQEQYSGILVPGGQGLMVDLIEDTNMSTLLQNFSQNGRPVGLICHAPALIVSIPKNENPFVGYRVTSVTSFEEWYIETFIMKGKPKVSKIARKLEDRGLEYKSSFLPGGNYAVRDRELITSQNPFSNTSFDRLYLEALSEYAKNGSLKGNSR